MNDFSPENVAEAIGKGVVDAVFKPTAEPSFMDPEKAMEINSEAKDQLNQMSQEDLKEALSNPQSSRQILSLVEQGGDAAVLSGLAGKVDQAIGSIFSDTMGRQQALKLVGDFKAQNPA